MTAEQDAVGHHATVLRAAGAAAEQHLPFGMIEQLLAQHHAGPRGHAGSLQLSE